MLQVERRIIAPLRNRVFHSLREQRRHSRVTLLGALGGSGTDHCLANLLAPLSLCQSLGVWARLVTAGAEIYLLSPGRYVGLANAVVQERAEILLSSGEILLTLLPLLLLRPSLTSGQRTHLSHDHFAGARLAKERL